MNNLTKEECEKALRHLRESVETWNYDFDEPISQEEYDAYDKAYGCLLDLINEHFDNPPLTFEEIEKFMWVWDNKYECYYEIIGKSNDECFFSKIQFEKNEKTLLVDYGDDSMKLEFEENRFYRKEVKE